MKYVWTKPGAEWCQKFGAQYGLTADAHSLLTAQQVKQLSASFGYTVARFVALNRLKTMVALENSMSEAVTRIPQLEQKELVAQGHRTLVAPDFKPPDLRKSFLGWEKDEAEEQTRFEALTLYGKTYVQPEGPGYASYHFESPSACYISYANAPASWRLSDGSNPPPKKQFNNVFYNPSTRTFTGTIVWAPLTFNSCSRWEYTMQLSECFGSICGGTLTEFPSGRNLFFAHDLNYKLLGEAGVRDPTVKHHAEPVAEGTELDNEGKPIEPKVGVPNAMVTPKEGIQPEADLEVGDV
jgi:hypothetical protein